MARVCLEHENQERRVQGGKEIIGRIQAAEPIEEGAQPSGGVRSREGKAQRQMKKECSRDTITTATRVT